MRDLLLCDCVLAVSISGNITKFLCVRSQFNDFKDGHTRFKLVTDHLIMQLKTEKHS